MSLLRTQIAEMMTVDPNQMPSQIAAELAVTEFDVVANLPHEMVTVIPRSELDSLLVELPNWGSVTTIVSVAGSIFEFKGALPKGKSAHGYYNLMTKGDGLHGHLKLDNIVNVALVSKPFMGSESHSIQLFDSSGSVAFKIYLGRDAKRVLLPGQVERFTALRKRFS